MNARFAIAAASLACSGVPDDPPPEDFEAAMADATASLGMPDRCETSERLYFRCTLADGDEVTVCGSAAAPDPWVRFVLESEGREALVYPVDDDVGWFGLSLEHEQYVRRSGPALRFAHEGRTYELSEISGAGPDDPGFAGLTISEGDAIVSERACDHVEVSAWAFLSPILDPISP